MTDARDRLVLVDDDHAKRYVLARQLRRHGFDVFEAGTAADGIALIDDATDVVILDIRLPDMSGLDVCRILKQDPATSHVMLLALSATYTTGEDRVRGLHQGADAYLVHPVQIDELLATIQALRRIRKAERERTELRARLDRTEALNRVVTETVTVGLLHLDTNGRCTFMNPAARMLTGHQGAPETFVLAAHLSSAIAQTNGDPARAYADETPVHKQEGELVLGSDRIPVRWSRIPVSGSGGSVIQIEDVREQRAAEAERELFLGVLGHDLRNPLNSIRLAARMLKLGAHSERDADLVDRIDRNVVTMSTLIQQLLAFATVRSAGLSLDHKPTDLADLVATVIESVSPTCPDTEIVLTRHGDTHGVWDPDRLRQIAQNLLTNACEHGASGLPVSTFVEDAGSNVVVRVHNWGEPIRAEDRERLFHPFRRASQRQGGLGLGLYIAQTIARAHGGTLELESSAEAGTTFVLTLPREGGGRPAARAAVR